MWLMSLVFVAHGLRCSVTCGISLDKELNPCPLHWQADYYPLHHQGNNKVLFLDLDVVIQIDALCKTV